MNIFLKIVAISYYHTNITSIWHSRTKWYTKKQGRLNSLPCCHIWRGGL